MPIWLKYLVSALTGFSAGAGAVWQSNPQAKMGNVILGGVIGSGAALGSLHITAPQDKEVVQIAKDIKDSVPVDQKIVGGTVITREKTDAEVKAEVKAS